MVRGDRSVDVFVRKVRQKLEKASPAWRYIHTHFGIGYRFCAEPLDGALQTTDSGLSEIGGDIARDPSELAGTEQEHELAHVAV
jgi:DNA-binding winged helix-turn-helix (wHTH) protein